MAAAYSLVFDNRALEVSQKYEPLTIACTGPSRHITITEGTIFSANRKKKY